MNVVPMRRREFITLLGGATTAFSLPARAQQVGKVPTIGYLGATSPSASSQWTAAFVQRLRQLGWIEGRTVAIEYRWAEGRSERYTEIAAEFIRLKVDIIATSGAGSLVIPIVFFVAQDPVGSGLVASLARPGGNVTGLSTQQTDIAGKRVQLLSEVVPGFGRLAILVNTGDPGAALDMREVQAAAHTLGLDVVTSEIRRAEDIAPAFEALKGRVDAMYVAAEGLVNANRTRINTLALAATGRARLRMRAGSTDGASKCKFTSVYRVLCDQISVLTRDS